jgi:hypothetical protein
MPSIQSILSKPCVASANERQTDPPLNRAQRPLCARSGPPRSRRSFAFFTEEARWAVSLASLPEHYISKRKNAVIRRVH